MSGSALRVAVFTGFFAAGIAAADSFEIFHAFSAAGTSEPTAALIAGTDGRLYGTTRTGGLFGRGSVYSLTPDGVGGWTFAELHAFSGPDGAELLAPLVQSADGSLWGTTSKGGEADSGTVFVLDASGRLTVLHSFANSVDGAIPVGGLVQAPDGSFLGKTSTGGLHGYGTIFRLTPEGTFTTLHAFPGFPEGGANSRAGLIRAADGNIYGTTSEGGEFNAGTVFRLDEAGTVTTIGAFDHVIGAYPEAPLVRASNGYFYGCTPFGGVYRIGYLGGLTGVDLPTLGETRGALIEGSDGLLYGTAIGNPGRLFRFEPSGSGLDLFAEVPELPYASLLELPDGRFVGASTGGSVFAAATNGEVEEIHLFRPTEGAAPRGGLIEASEGWLHGTTGGGGADGVGTVFRMNLAGVLETLHDLAFFGGTTWVPNTTLLESGGDFYGTAWGPLLGYGSVFRYESDGTFTTVHSFSGFDGEEPEAALAVGEDGALYGTTTAGGENSYGTAYRIDGTGAFSLLHSFEVDEGARPEGRLLLYDGYLYGTAQHGGANGYGTLFRMDDEGTVTPLVDFDGGELGGYPRAGLLQASDGNLYGTTSSTIFRLVPGGSLTTIHTFAFPEGFQPMAALIQAPDGNLYGTTAGGGSNTRGTIFRSDIDGDLTTLHEFSGPDGEYPRSELLLASDGNFYGTAPSGGPTGAGVVYRIATKSMFQIDSVSPTSGRAAGGGSFVVSGGGFQPAVSIAMGGQLATGIVGVDRTTARGLSPALDPGHLYDVVVTQNGYFDVVLAESWFADFLDVPSTNLFHDSIESIVRAHITAGCGAGQYCPNSPVSRAQMAVFLIKAEHGSAYLPPPCTGVFSDVPCPSLFADWVETLAAEGVTAGCGTGLYCPNDPVTREQMAVFLLKTKEGSGYVPPPATGEFGDVPAGNAFAPWIEEIYARGITGGCSASPLLYCPGNPNTRGQMAVFLVRTFGL